MLWHFINFILEVDLIGVAYVCFKCIAIQHSLPKESKHGTMQKVSWKMLRRHSVKDQSIILYRSSNRFGFQTCWLSSLTMIMDLTEASCNQCTIVVRYIFTFFIRCYVQTPEKSLVVSRRAETFSVKFYRICRTYVPTSLL